MDQQIAFKQLLSLSDSILFRLRSMKLHVYVLEAGGLPPCESQSASVYTKLKIGKHNSRTKPVDSAVGVCWNQEFVFRLSDDDTQSDFLQVSVFRQFEAAGKELLGRCRISMASLLEEEKRALPPTWFSLQPKHKNASKSKFNDHGHRDNEVRENGEGWLLTVALIEGINFPSINSGFLDPYVMLSCNGITKTSSVQLRTQDPQWNEIIEFDAMQEPPSVLDVEIFNFDGPFDSSISLGRAEINLIKHNSDELSDMWVPLEGKTNQESELQLHLRIFLENTRGAETIKEYLNKMGKQVGKKLNIQSPHKNSTFQKLFGLPAEEYLIKDYSCSLKRKMPLQGRMFVSARVLGFYSNLLGHKTKFFFMWEDVDEITELPPSFFTVGSPALQIILKPGRGLDARHGAKGQDGNGRLKFVFHSFMSFNTGARTIKALWRSKGRDETSISEEELESDEKPESLTDDTESISNSNLNTILNLDDVKLTKTFSIELSIPVDSLMEVFNGGNIETKIMSKVGCLDYSVKPWEAVKLKPSFLERQVSYKFNRYMSIFGSEVVSTQVKYPSTIGNGWIIDDVMTLHNVPFGDHFRIHLRYEMIRVQSDLAPISECDVFVGVEWLKSTKFKKRIVKNICVKLTQRSKEIFELAETELVCLKHDC